MEEGLKQNKTPNTFTAGQGGPGAASLVFVFFLKKGERTGEVSIGQLW